MRQHSDKPSQTKRWSARDTILCNAPDTTPIYTLSLHDALPISTGPIKGLTCDVLIGDAWMLYDIVRADLRSLSPRAADDVVRSALADVAGLPPSDVVTRWQTQSGGQCTVACGMPAAVLPSLQTLLQLHKL